MKNRKQRNYENRKCSRIIFYKLKLPVRFKDEEFDAYERYVELVFCMNKLAWRRNKYNRNRLIARMVREELRGIGMLRLWISLPTLGYEYQNRPKNIRSHRKVARFIKLKMREI